MAATILVVDDDPIIRDLLAEALGDEGYGVRQCATQHAADAWLQSELPDMLIVDVRFPDPPNGIELIEQLCQRPTTIDLPIIIYSADPSFLQTQATRIAALDCWSVAKPFDLEALFALITGALAAKTSIRLSVDAPSVDLCLMTVRCLAHKPTNGAIA